MTHWPISWLDAIGHISEKNSKSMLYMQLLFIYIHFSELRLRMCMLMYKLCEYIFSMYLAKTFPKETFVVSHLVYGGVYTICVHHSMRQATMTVWYRSCSDGQIDCDTDNRAEKTYVLDIAFWWVIACNRAWNVRLDEVSRQCARFHALLATMNRSHTLINSKML